MEPIQIFILSMLGTMVAVCLVIVGTLWLEERKTWKLIAKHEKEPT
jgi:hypothetical protein